MSVKDIRGNEYSLDDLIQVFERQDRRGYLIPCDDDDEWTCHNSLAGIYAQMGGVANVPIDSIRQIERTIRDKYMEQVIFFSSLVQYMDRMMSEPFPDEERK